MRKRNFKQWWNDLETVEKGTAIIFLVLFLVVLVGLLSSLQSCSTLQESTQFVKDVPAKIKDIDEKAAKQVKQFRCEMKAKTEEEKKKCSKF